MTQYFTYQRQVPLPGGDVLGFRRGRGFFARDPYNAVIGTAPQRYTSQWINQQVAQRTQGMPGGSTPQQIRATAQSEISPLIQAVTASITGQAQNASNAVKGYTSDLASKLASINFAAPYQQGEQAQAAADNALHQALSGAGTSDAADLSSRLSVINDPSVAAAASDVAGNGVANANANLALGTDAMSNLIADAAAAGSFGQKLPGIAQLAGVQQLAGIGQNATNQIGTQTQQIESQLPSIIQNLTSESDTNAANKTQAANSLYQYLTGVSQGNSQNLLKLKENQVARNDAFASAGAKATAPDPTWSKTNGYKSDANGDPILGPNGQIQPLPGFKVNPAGTGVVKVTGGGSGGSAGAATKKARQSALAKASSMADSELGKLAAAVTMTSAPANPLTGGKATKRQVRPRVGSALYNQAVNRTVALLTPLLSPYLTQQQLTKFVQSRALTIFAPAGT